MTMLSKPSRRAVLQGAASALLAAAPTALLAQTGPLKLGVLTPLTGAGSTDGPRMLAAIQAVAKEVNAAGGILGRTVEFVVEDDQTNPDAAVRAARKLIDVDQVPVIMGTWASAVTTAVAPLCWESKVFLTTCSGADPITKLPHQGYLVRTQPNNYLQATHHADFIAGLGMKRVFALSIQSPFTVPTHERLHDVLAEKGSQLIGTLTYDKDKTSYRSEVDQALKTKPDMIYLNGYAPDETVVLKDLFKAGYEGAKFSQSYSVTQPVLDALPQEVTEAIYTVQPSADVDSKAFELAGKRLGRHARHLLLPGDRLDQPRLPVARQGRIGQRHGDPRQHSEDLAGLRHQGGDRCRRLGPPRQGPGDQLRGRERPLRFHRDRRHHRLQVPLPAGRERQVQVPESRLIPRWIRLRAIPALPDAR